MSTPHYRRTPAAERRLSMRARLTVFSCGMTVLILLLVWGLTTFLLQPRYNRFIRTQLSQKASLKDAYKQLGQTATTYIKG